MPFIITRDVMKKLLFIPVLIWSFFTGFSQECTTMWPYIYPEFKEGVLYMTGGGKLEGKFNVHVQESRLHYLYDNIIKETSSEDIVLAKIGVDTYMSFEGQLMKVVGSEERGFVATLILGDFDKLTNSGGAYGGSSNSSATMKLSSVEIGGKSIVNHMELRQNKENALPLPLKYRYFIATKGVLYPATKKGIASKLDKIQQDEFKKFLKANKIKWKDPQSLLTLLDFFSR